VCVVQPPQISPKTGHGDKAKDGEKKTQQEQQHAGRKGGHDARKGIPISENYLCLVGFLFRSLPNLLSFPLSC